MKTKAAPAVLVVEDEVDLLATYHRLFGRDGFRVVTAAPARPGPCSLVHASSNARPEALAMRTRRTSVVAME